MAEAVGGGPEVGGLVDGPAVAGGGAEIKVEEKAWVADEGAEAAGADEEGAGVVAEGAGAIGYGAGIDERGAGLAEEGDGGAGYEAGVDEKVAGGNVDTRAGLDEEGTGVPADDVAVWTGGGDVGIFRTLDLSMALKSRGKMPLFRNAWKTAFLFAVVFLYASSNAAAKLLLVTTSVSALCRTTSRQ